MFLIWTPSSHNVGAESLTTRLLLLLIFILSHLWSRQVYQSHTVWKSEDLQSVGGDLHEDGDENFVPGEVLTVLARHIGEHVRSQN